MRAWIMLLGLVQAVLLVACEHPAKKDSKVAGKSNGDAALNRPASRAAMGRVEQSIASPAETPAAAQGNNQWLSPVAYDFGSRLIIRSGQASIEVDSLEPAITELRRIAQRAGGFVADASVQTGRNQLRSATLQLKVPASRFDDLTDWLEPLGKLQFVNVGAQDVSEEYVDLTARVANGHRLEERLVELLRTRTGKLSDVLSVERELARVREEIERMEGRMRFLKANAQLSTLSVSLYEPQPVLASPGRNPIAEAFRTAWRNFVALLAGVIASLGFVLPLVVLGWGAVVVGKRYRRKPA
jgi:hypothetical protein